MIGKPFVAARPPMPADPFIYTKRAPFMQRISDLVRTGHHRYVEGTVPIEKAGALYEKFVRLYDVHLDRLQASRHRKKGFASGRLLMTPITNDVANEHYLDLHWILVVTDGKFALAESEKRERWRDAMQDRVIFSGYELVRLTKPQHPKPVWTWRYEKTREKELRESLRSAIRLKHEDELRRMIHLIWRTPGFAGARDQVKKMGVLIKAEWKRSRKDGEPMPEIPARIGYVQRIPDKGMPASQLLKTRLADRMKQSQVAEKTAPDDVVESSVKKLPSLRPA